MMTVRTSRVSVMAGLLTLAIACTDTPVPTGMAPEVPASHTEGEIIPLSWNTATTALASLTYSGGKAVVTSTIDTPLQLALRESLAIGRADAFQPYAPARHTATVQLNVELNAGGEWQPTCPFQSSTANASGECPFTLSSTTAYSVSASTSHALVPPQPSRETSLAAASFAPPRSVASAAVTGDGSSSGGETGTGTTAPTGPAPFSRPRTYDDCIDHYWYYPLINFFEYRYTTGDCPAINEMARAPMSSATAEAELPRPTAEAERSLAPGAVHPAATVHLVRVAKLKDGVRAAVIRGLVDSSLVILVTPGASDAELVAAWRAMDGLARQADWAPVLLAVRERRAQPDRAEAADIALRARQLRGFLESGTMRPVRNFGPGVGITFLHLPAPR